MIACSFCGKENQEAKHFFRGYNAIICDDCISLCKEMIEETSELAPQDLKSLELLKPTKIHAILDQFVIGQELAKKILSVGVYNHYKRISTQSSVDAEEVELQKSNILLVGPTGSGKTLFAQTLAKILNVPFAIADATTLTEAGYVGEDVENILVQLLQNAEFDIEKAQRGIIYVDEIDKIARKNTNVSITRDVSGEGVQQALLKMIESTVASIPPKGGRKHPQQELLSIDTTNILFIFGGSFVGLEELIQKRIGKKQIGFMSPLIEQKDQAQFSLLSQVEAEDLIRYGLIPEFVGRIPVIAPLHQLSAEGLFDVLTKPKNALLKQYQTLFELDHVLLKVTTDGLYAIAKQALKRNVGARGLRAIMDSLLQNLMFEIPSHKNINEVVIDEAVVEKQKEPILIYRPQDHA